MFLHTYMDFPQICTICKRILYLNFHECKIYFGISWVSEIAKERSRSLGKAALGGPWQLIDHNGQVKSSKDFHGQWVLLYFGFTHCPDICRDDIEKMIKVVDLIGECLEQLIVCSYTVYPRYNVREKIRHYIQGGITRLDS